MVAFSVRHFDRRVPALVASIPGPRSGEHGVKPSGVGGKRFDRSAETGGILHTSGGGGADFFPHPLRGAASQATDKASISQLKAAHRRSLLTGLEASPKRSDDNRTAEAPRRRANLRRMNWSRATIRGQ